MKPEALHSIVVRGILTQLHELAEERDNGRLGYATPRGVIFATLLALESGECVPNDIRAKQTFLAERLLEALEATDPNEGAVTREALGDPREWVWA